MINLIENLLTSTPLEAKNKGRKEEIFIFVKPVVKSYVWYERPPQASLPSPPCTYSGDFAALFFHSYMFSIIEKSFT